MNSPFRGIMLFMMTFSLGGCAIPIPAGGEDPYTKEVTDLQLENTTKADVLRRFGKPAATYLNGSKFVYSTYKQTLVVPYIFELWPGGMGVATGGKYHFLILNFDEQDILTEFQLENAGYMLSSCSDTGICHDGAGHVVQLASKTKEAKAKEFLFPGNQCGIYMYSDDFRNTRQTTMTLNGDYQGFVGQWGIRPFFYWQLDPGKHELTYYPGPGTLSFTCRQGELVFVLLTMTDDVPTSLEVVDNSEGRRQIDSSGLVFPKRKLVIPESGHSEH